MDRFRATVIFTAEGEQLAAFRDALRRYGIRCRAQQMRGNAFHAVCAARDENRLRYLAEVYKIVLDVRRRGLRYLLRPCRFRFGLLCGLVLGGMFLYWCNAAVRRIEITGNARIQDGEILRVLADMGVQYGTPFRDLRYTWLEQRLRLDIDDIEWVTLRHTGGRLIIDLTEEREPPEMVHDRMPCNVVADVSAQITGIDVRGGHAVCKAGDTVRPGDVLITGVQQDQLGLTHYYHADGIVTGIYPDEFTEEQPFVAELPVRGRSVSETVLSVFGRRIPLTFGFQPPADLSGIIYEEDAEPFMLFSRRTPLTLLHCRYTQQETTVTAFSEDEVYAMLEESARRYERNFHANDLILSRKAAYSRTDLGISLKINYIFEGTIGKRSEIFVKLP